MSDDLREGEVKLDPGPAEDAGLRFVGVIRTPFVTREMCPRQGDPENGPVCRIEVSPEWEDALDGIERFEVIEVLSEWVDTERRGKAAKNMSEAHLRTAAKRGSWGVGRFNFRVQTDQQRVFDLYYDRAPKGGADRAGHWVLWRELRAEESLSISQPYDGPSHAIDPIDLLHELLLGHICYSDDSRRRPYSGAP